MNTNRIVVTTLFALSVLLLPHMINDAYAGGGPGAACCGCDTGDSITCNTGTSGMCRIFQVEFCENNGGIWQGPGTDCSDPDPCLSPSPGTCTVSVGEYENINNNLICLCQNQTRKGKDTFQVIECGNPGQIADCEKSQGEVKQYINADDSAELFTFDCSEISCVDICSND